MIISIWNILQTFFGHPYFCADCRLSHSHLSDRVVDSAASCKHIRVSDWTPNDTSDDVTGRRHSDLGARSESHLLLDRARSPVLLLLQRPKSQMLRLQTHQGAQRNVTSG